MIGIKFLLFVTSTLFGFIASNMARKQNRDPGFWFLMGFFFGALSLLTLLVLRRKDLSTPHKKVVVPKTPLRFDEWYYLDSTHSPQGPIPFQDLAQLWSDKRLEKNTFVWSEGMEEWNPIEKIPDLYQDILRQAHA